MVNRKEPEIDITRNIKIIEHLKSELLMNNAFLFKSLAGGSKEGISDSVIDIISNIIITSYLLGKRLGIEYSTIERKVKEKIRLGIVEENDIERYYRDLSELFNHLNLA